ncbi:MAG TPA: CcmD family protein [Polyangiaceae bacterium]|nr:CcmD family protein [Polyangiaceae bacterium]
MTQAQPESTTSATLSDPNSRSTEFVAVQGGGETTSAASLLIAAYLVMWGLVFAFVFLNWRRQGRVEARIADLEKAVAAGGGGGSERQ